jgi:hypothetical protein
MGKSTRDLEIQTSLAGSSLSIQAIDPTLSWAKPALFEELHQTPDPLAELSLFMETDIGRYKSHLASAL